MGAVRTWMTITVLLALTTGAAATLFPYSGSGNEVLENVTFEKTFSLPFPFAGNTYSSVHISDNGVISFGTAVVTADSDTGTWIAPYGKDVGGSATYGRIYAEEYNTATSAVIDMANAHIQYQFPALSFSATFVYVVTWYNVRPFPAATSAQENTFQVVLASDGTASYVMYNYDNIEWYPAVVGMSDGDPTKGYRICGSGTDTVQTLSTTAQSPYGTAGIYVFRMDTAPLQQASCTEMYPLEASTTIGSPYTLEIVDSNIVSASGDGLSRVKVRRTAIFEVDTHGATGGNVEVEITSPNGDRVTAEVYSRGHGDYRVKWTPRVPGIDSATSDNDIVHKSDSAPATYEMLDSAGTVNSPTYTDLELYESTNTQQKEYENINI